MGWYWYLVFFAVNAGLALIPASMARKKGHSFGGYWCLSFFVSFLIGLIVGVTIKDRNSDVSPPMRSCSKCGISLPAGTEFCSACGTQVHSDGQCVSQPQSKFVTHYMGLIVLVMLLFVTLLVGTGSMYFYRLENFRNIMSNLIPYGLIAFAVLISARSKGPDFSLGAVMGLGAVVAATVATQGSLVSGIIVGLLACAVIGLINGVITVYLKVPSFIPTILVTVILRWVLVTLVKAPIQAENLRVIHGTPDSLPIGVVTLLPFALIVVLVFISVTKLRRPMNELTPADTRKPVYMLAYMAGSILAGMAGIYIVLNIGVAMPVFGSGYEWHVLLLFGIMMATRITEKPVASVFYTLLAALICVLFSNATSSLFGITPIHNIVLTVLFGLLFIIMGIFARKETMKRLIQFK